MHGDFFDTNILVYAASADDMRFDRAYALLATGGIISVQVLNEFVNVARRKMHLDWATIHGFLQGVRTLNDVRSIDLAVHEKAMKVCELYKLGIYDATIVAAALSAGCATLYSEDIHHGLVIDRCLTIVNPFVK